MSKILKKIVNDVEKNLDKNKIQTQIKNNEKTRKRTPESLKKSINNTPKNKNPIIAELKYSSPSKNKIQSPDKKNPVNYIKQMKKAPALSILTEQKHFNGDKKYIQTARSVYRGPILRKDFIIHPIQIKETRYLGADAVLLITSLLEEKLDKYIEICRENSLEALVEVRSKKEAEIAIDAGAEIIGINNRNLNNLKIDLNTTKKLSKNIPKNKTIISESGLKTKHDIKRLKNYCDGFLIGTSIMKSKKPRDKLRDLACA